MCDLLLGKLSHNESSQASGCITLIGIVLDDETLPWQDTPRKTQLSRKKQAYVTERGSPDAWQGGGAPHEAQHSSGELHAPYLE